MEHSALRDNEMAGSLRGDDEVTCPQAVDFASSMELTNRRFPGNGSDVLQNEGDSQDRPGSPMLTGK